MRKTGVANILRDSNLSEPAPAAWIREDLSVIFSARSRDSVNLWQVSLAPGDPRPSGRPRRLTFGADIETEPAVAGNENSRQIVFTSLVSNPDIWSLPLAINKAKATAAVQRQTQNIAADIQPSVSVDGRKAVFTSSRSGASQVWIKDLTGGAETQLTFSSTPKDWPIFSSDGSQVAYSLYRSQTIYLVSVGGGEERKLCDSCGPVKSWSSDGLRILFHSGSNQPLRTIGLLDLAIGLSRDLIKHSRYSLYHPHFSPDNIWVAFHAKLSPNRTQLFIVLLCGNVAPAENDWIAVTDGSENDQDPQWSPDGRLFYFFSERDGFRCLWAQRLEAETKRPLGSPFAVYHFHSARRSLMNLGLSSLDLSLARDKIVFPLGKLTGAIWIADERREH